MYLIAPCVLTAILAVLIFYLPAASGERMVVGCTILLALSVFFLLATNYIPETSEHVPLVGRSVWDCCVPEEALNDNVAYPITTHNDPRYPRALVKRGMRVDRNFSISDITRW